MIIQLSYISFFTLFYYLTSHQWFIIALLSLDNLFISYNTFCHIYQLNYINTFYHDNWIDRYIYYILLTLIKLLLETLLWHQSLYLNYLLFLTTIPFCLQYIQKGLKINALMNIIKHRFKKILKLCLNEFIKKILTTICLTALQCDPFFTKKEISLLLKENHKQLLFQFIKSCVLLSIIKTLSQHGLSLQLIKKFYNAKAEHQYVDPYPSINDFDKLKNIVIKRQWHHFFNPYIIDLLLKLYQEKQNQPMALFFKKVEQATAKLLVILSIIKILSFYELNTNSLTCIAGLISHSLIPIKKWDTTRLMIRLVGVNIGLLMNQLLGLVICEYGSLCLPLLYWLYHKLYGFIKKNYYLLIHYNDYNFYILLHIFILPLLKFTLPLTKYIYLTSGFIILNAKHVYLTSWFILLGSLSHYHPYHMMILGFIFYIYINITLCHLAPKPKLKLLLLDNYKSPSLIKKEYKPIIVKNQHKSIIINHQLHMIKSMHNPKYNKRLV